MEAAGRISPNILIRPLWGIIVAILGTAMILHLRSSQLTAAEYSELDLGNLLLAMESGDIPSEEEIIMWEQLLQRLKNQIDAGVPLTEVQIDQLQRLYDLTKAYVPWLENLFELLKTIIQQITLDNAALEIELSNQPNQKSDE